MIIIEKGRLPIKVWAEETDLVGYNDAISQAVDLANHPLARRWIALMPDFHIGYGMPIGGVVACAGGVIPNAVGVDIGCGVLSAKTNLKKDQLPRDRLVELSRYIHKLVPVGFNHQKSAQSHPFFQISPPEKITQGQHKAAQTQIGTLGSGNHFIEVQSDSDGVIWLMVHCGSRNLGKRVADFYHRLALDQTQRDPQLPAKDLAYLAADQPQYQMYLDAMNYCLHFAEANRALILERLKSAFAALGLLISIRQQFDCHHNFAALEKHYGQQLLVHRKGAIRAEGLLTIPGTMGTASYVCEGLKPTESFNSCAHGAGRVIGRREAKRRFSEKHALQAMKKVVIHLRPEQYDELPMAYKDIDRIIKLQSELARPLYKLQPLAVVKG